MNIYKYLCFLVISSTLIYLFGYIRQILLLKVEELKLKIERERETRKHIEKLLEMETERIKVENQEKFNNIDEELKCHQK